MGKKEVKKYVRDKRSPKPKNKNVSKVMSANKAKNTKPEVQLRKLLWVEGLRGYRTNYKKAPGRPDIAFPTKKVAIFIHGCFWHRCPICKLPMPKTNQAFWANKFNANKKRDKLKERTLKKLGWKVTTIWECELDNGDFIRKKVLNIIENGKRN